MAFALMSVIPMLVCGYLIIYYIFPTVEDLGDVSVIFVTTIALVLMGFYLAKKIIYPIIEITTHAKVIAEGNSLGKVLEVKGEDEIGELSGSLNRLSSRLKENMSELRSYGEQIKQINMEINKKVFALSSLLQIGNLITTACDLDEIFGLIVEKVSQLEVDAGAFVMLLEEDSDQLTMRAQTNIKNEKLNSIKIKSGQGALGRVCQNSRPLVIDMQRRPKVMEEELVELLQAKNIVALPITCSGKVIGILGAGNNIDNFLFSDDEIELIGVFAKQVAVAIENEMLLRKTEELTVKDELTGLYNESYIRSRLDEEIKRAVSYQRPCSFIVIELNNFGHYRDVSGKTTAEKALKKIAQTLRESTSEIDKIARFSDHQFAVILPERNKQQTSNLAENILKEIRRFSLGKERVDPLAALTVSGGISSAPIDGTTSVELINKALYYIEQAKAKGVSDG